MEPSRELALMTGASSGIGRETALRLAKVGSRVIALARRRERLIELAENAPNITPKQVNLCPFSGWKDGSKGFEGMTLQQFLIDLDLGFSP